MKQLKRIEDFIAENDVVLSKLEMASTKGERSASTCYSETDFTDNNHGACDSTTHTYTDDNKVISIATTYDDGSPGSYWP
jgi:hypothetical protein